MFGNFTEEARKIIVQENTFVNTFLALTCKEC